MTTISFFRQARRDGGIRTGIDIEGETVLEQFDEGEGEPDPALLWYVDVRCQGHRLPRTPRRARDWLVRQEGDITRALRALADELSAGIDPEGWPLRKAVRSKTAGVRITIACSAVRRVEALHISDVLRDIAEQWRVRLDGLPQEQVVWPGG